MAILAVVRRDHFRPVMGSPAVSYSSRNSIRVTMSAVFFPRACVRRRSGGGGPAAPSCLAVGGGRGGRGGGAGGGVWAPKTGRRGPPLLCYVHRPHVAPA